MSGSGEMRIKSGGEYLMERKFNWKGGRPTILRSQMVLTFWFGTFGMIQTRTRFITFMMIILVGSSVSTSEFKLDQTFISQSKVIIVLK